MTEVQAGSRREGVSTLEIGVFQDDSGQLRAMDVGPKEDRNFSQILPGGANAFMVACEISRQVMEENLDQVKVSPYVDFDKGYNPVDSTTCEEIARHLNDIHDGPPVKRSAYADSQIIRGRE